MKNYNRISAIIRLVARIWGSLMLIFLLFMIGSHVIGSEVGGGFNSTTEKLIFILTFPVGTAAGLALAWKWEGLGGFISAGSIVGLFAIRPALISIPLFIGMGFIGILYIAYWWLSRGKKPEVILSGNEKRKIRRNNWVIALLLCLMPVLYFAFSIYQHRDKSYISTHKDSSYDKKLTDVEVMMTIDDPLIPVFAHSFEHSFTSAIESNGIDAKVAVNQNNDDTPAITSMAKLCIEIKPLYRMRDDGYEVIVGTDYKVKLMDQASGGQVWKATGKVDYITMYSSDYIAGEGTRKEFAWNTTAAIVNALVKEINKQEPVEIHTITEERAHYGQRID